MLPVKAALGFYGNRYLLTLGLIIIVLSGYSALTNLPRIEDPHITPRFPRITTQFPGASAQRVEALVTDPIEDALNEIIEIKEINSASVQGISIINLELADNVKDGENQRVFTKIQNQLDSVQDELPAGVLKPDLDDKFTAVAFSKIIAVSWEKDIPAQLGIMKRLAEDIADIMRNVSGSDIVRIYGAPEEEILVEIDRGKLADLGLSTANIAQIIANADSKVPAGSIRNDNSVLFIEVEGEIDITQRIGRIPIATSMHTSQSVSAKVLTLGDIAIIHKQEKTPFNDRILHNGKRSVLIAARTNKNVRLDKWAEKVDAKIAPFVQHYGGGFNIETIFNQNIYTQARLLELGNNLIAGALLIILIVMFSMGIRSALIVGSALPLSGALALFGLSVMGQQLHQMAIFGMIIAIGLLIDNAIVMTDEIRKHLDSGKSTSEAISRSVRHLFVPLLASTLTTILGFMPVFLLPAAMGDFVGPIAVAVVLALIASFFIAVSIIPALCGIFLNPKTNSKDTLSKFSSGINAKWLSVSYKKLMVNAFKHPALTLLITISIPIAGYMLSGTLGQQFFPPADRDQFEIEINLPYDASIDHTHKLIAEIDQQLRQRKGVKALSWRLGASFPTVYYNKIMTVTGNSSYAHGIVTANSLADGKRLIDELRTELELQYTQAQIVISPFAQGPPIGAPIAIEITGPENNTLKVLGEKLRAIMHQIPGIVATNATVTGGLPKLNFVADEGKVAQAGLSLVEVSRQIEANLEGHIGGSLQEDIQELPIRVRLPFEQRSNLDEIRNMPIVSPLTDDWIPASSLGKFELIPDSGSISRKSGNRANVVLGYIDQDYLVIDVSNAIEQKMRETGFSVPSGYEIIVSGDSAEQAEAFDQLLTYLPVLLMLMITTIVLSFKSVRLALTIFAVAFLSVGLGMLSLWIGGYARGFNAIIGSIGLIGVAINGTIVVLAAIRANPEAKAGNIQSIIEETIGCSRHIVSTTLTTIGGFIPLLLFSGGDFWPPLAIVIAGGVGFSIILSLGFSPVMYKLLLGRNYQPSQS